MKTCQTTITVEFDPGRQKQWDTEYFHKFLCSIYDFDSSAKTSVNPVIRRERNAELHLGHLELSSSIFTSTTTVKSVLSIPPSPQTMFSGRLAAQAARSAAQRAPIAPRAAVRAYAQASSAASSKPPVAFYGVDGTYASALVSSIGYEVSSDAAVGGCWGGTERDRGSEVAAWRAQKKIARTGEEEDDDERSLMV
jgi:hypothetical protein